MDMSEDFWLVEILQNPFSEHTEGFKGSKVELQVARAEISE
jgi:hypothetical protein